MFEAKEMGKEDHPNPNKKLLREKLARRASLINAVEDYNIQILALTGEIRYLDSEIEWLVEDVKLEAIRVANEKFKNFEKKELARLEKKQVQVNS